MLLTEDHITPFNTTQNFLFCSFTRHVNWEQMTVKIFIQQRISSHLP